LTLRAKTLPLLAQTPQPAECYAFVAPRQLNATIMGDKMRFEILTEERTPIKVIIQESDEVRRAVHELNI
jgi:hypothetical protein